MYQQQQSYGGNQSYPSGESRPEYQYEGSQNYQQTDYGSRFEASSLGEKEQSYDSRNDYSGGVGNYREQSYEARRDEYSNRGEYEEQSYGSRREEGSYYASQRSYERPEEETYTRQEEPSFGGSRDTYGNQNYGQDRNEDWRSGGRGGYQPSYEEPPSERYGSQNEYAYDNSQRRDEDNYNEYGRYERSGRNYESQEGGYEGGYGDNETFGAERLNLNDREEEYTRRETEEEYESRY
jgi:hypothetical protein